MSRTKKRPYTGSKRFDRTCRNHGACSYCVGRRLFFDRRARAAADDQVREYGARPPLIIEWEDGNEGEAEGRS